MIVKLVEATQNLTTGFNYGKFAVCRFEEQEWRHPSAVDAAFGLGTRSLLARCGWSPDNVIVLDLQTFEGAGFRPGGLPEADLEKHRVWVCPMYEPFLTWLYQQDLSDLNALPDVVELPDAPPAMAGYRRHGAG